MPAADVIVTTAVIIRFEFIGKTITIKIKKEIIIKKRQ